MAVIWKRQQEQRYSLKVRQSSHYFLNETIIAIVRGVGSTGFFLAVQQSCARNISLIGEYCINVNGMLL